MRRKLSSPIDSMQDGDFNVSDNSFRQEFQSQQENAERAAKLRN